MTPTRALGLDGVRLSGSACLGLADGVEGALVEITPDGRSVQGAGVHTNHCLDPGLRRLQGPVDFLADSEERLARACALRRAGARLEDLLADTAGGYHGIDQPPDPALEDHDRTETVLATVIVPDRRLLRIAAGRPSQTGFTQSVVL